MKVILTLGWVAVFSTAAVGGWVLGRLIVEAWIAQ